jgi:solute carrier family 25 (mitochondrial carnitine/acylcarnitine transporter), member 20/29
MSLSDSQALRASLISGCFSGVVGVSSTYPLEMIRVRLQTQRKNNEYKNFSDCVKKTIRGEGLRGLYKGMSAPLLGATLTKTIDFGIFGAVRNALDKRPGGQNKLSNVVIAGMMSASAASVILGPIDRLKILLALQRSDLERARALGVSTEGKSAKLQYRGPFDLVRHQGFRGIYRGWLITLYREIVYGAVYFSAFQYLRTMTQKALGSSDQLPFGVLMLCGGLTGSLMWTLMFPIDVIKTKVQANTGSPVSMLLVARRQWAAEGVRGFYKGLSAAVLRSFPAHGIVLATYTFVMDKMT